MGLQIRVKHALGQRVLELADRTLDEPVVVGRASTADVQVPSATVAPRHCVLFIHEGRWAVQDLGAGTTFVNGAPVAGAAMLQIGDRIQVGSDAGAATIEIDPAAAAEGRTGYAGSGLSHRQQPPAAAGGYAAAGYAQSPYAMPQQMPPQYPAPSQYENAGYAPPGDYGEGHDAADSSDDVSLAPSTSPTYSSYKRRPANSSGMIAVMIVAVVLVGGVVALVLYRQMNKPPVVQKPPEVVVIKSGPSKPQGLFEDGPATSDTTLDKLGKPATAGGKKPEIPTASGVMPAGAATIEPRTASAGDDAPASTDRPPRPLESATVRPGDDPKGAGPRSGGDEPAMDPVRKPGGGGDEPAMDPIRKPGGGGDGPAMDPVRKPGGGGDEPVMDPIRKPGGGGGEPAMDPIRKPSPTAPAGTDAEALDTATLASWEDIKKLAEMPGKESYAVLRLEDFRRQNPGKYDAELDQFIDQKMDRLWWERIHQLFQKIEALKSTMKETQLAIFDESNPQVKEEKMKSLKAMQSELEASTKMLRDTMGYAEANPPNLDSSDELAALARKRDKLKYEGWKKSTLYYIKSNQGRLQWMND